MNIQDSSSIRRIARVVEKRRADAQLTGMAGELLTAGKLFKFGYQVTLTLGNAKKVDLFVHNTRTNKTFAVQVKTLRKKNCFPMHRENIDPGYVYVFVLLNEANEEEDFFIVPGKIILDDINRFFGTCYQREAPAIIPAINFGPLKDFRANWDEFEA